MKKIISVALSTAMAFSMFASVAFGDTVVLTPQDKYDALKAKGIFVGYPDGLSHLEKEMTRAEFAKVITKVMGLKETLPSVLSYKDANYNAKHWAAPYIEAVSVAGVMQGKDLTKKLFDPTAHITIQEMATVLVKAMHLELPKTADNTATEWAKLDVQAAINAGLIGKDLNYQSNATRTLLVTSAFAAEAALAVPVVTTATKVSTVSATNLKEVVVTFDGTVDVESAETAGNYTLKSGKVIKSVLLSADLKTATLSLDSTLTNNKSDALSVANVNAGNKVIGATQVAFNTVDNVLPAVESIKSLGTKSVKVVFSEPINDLKQSNFTLDGKEYYGKVDLGTNNRTAILTPYSASALAVGNHKLVVSAVKDYANFVSLTSTHDFEVVVDTAAPTITEASATLETVTITFSEDVDKSTVSSSNVYWKSGTDKKTASGEPVRLADNKYKFFFDATTKALPTGSVVVYVDAVKDYSGNTIAAGTNVVVTPVIDQERPVVAKVTAVTYDQIKITFSKNLLASSVMDTKNYTVLNKDGKVVSVKDAGIDPTNAKAVLVNLYSKLSTGTNTINVKNVKDNTRLQNTMLDYSGTIALGDTDGPTISSSMVNATDRRVVVKFNEAMDVESLTNYSNYLVTINGEQQVLNTNNAEISVLQDATAVAITFAETINGKKTVLSNIITPSSTIANVSKLTILGVKDTTSNLLQEFTKQTAGREISTALSTVVTTARFSTDYDVTKVAKLVNQKTLKVNFSAGINQATAGAFTVLVDGLEQQISSVDIDGTSVATINLANNFRTTSTGTNGVSVIVNLAQLTTIAGEKAGTSATPTITINTAAIQDAVAPTITTSAIYPTVSGATYESIKIIYSEDLVGSSVSALNNSDYVITRISDNKVLDAEKDYVVTIVGNEVSIELKDNTARTQETAYRVVVTSAKRIKDAANNVIADSSNESAKVKVRP